MTQEKVSPLRERMMADMRIPGICDKAQKSHISREKYENDRDFARIGSISDFKPIV